MTDRPVADREPLSAIRAAADYLEDADDGTRPYARVLAERLRALDAARTHPDEAGLLREALERLATDTTRGFEAAIREVLELPPQVESSGDQS